ncbi:DUF2637 domain-containing protein [Streptacidiphilus sp. PAMC 29251]
MNDEGQRARAADRIRGAALWLRDTGLGGFGFALVLVVALAGWSASFIGLHAFGAGHMSLSQRAAWLVPMTFDGAPAGLSIVVMRAGIHGRSATLWRILIIAFTLLSSWINWEHIGDPTGRDVAALMPPSAVILFEGLMSEVRAAAKRRNGGLLRPSLHPLRWVFDLTGTWSLVRCYVLDLPLPAAMDPALKAPRATTHGAPTQAAEAPQAPAESATQSATVDLAKRPRAMPQSAMADATEAPSERPADDDQSATDTVPKAPSKRPSKTPSGRSKVDVRGAARDAIKALYADTGKRPKESDMIAALKAAKLPHSRQFANARRLEVERDDPHLAALGSDNVRTLTA